MLGVALVATALIWFGLTLGLSFIETPLKFQAPGVTLTIGLEIGRLVFGVLNKIEIGLAVCDRCPADSRPPGEACTRCARHRRRHRGCTECLPASAAG